MTSDPFADQMLAAPALIAYIAVEYCGPLAADIGVLLAAGVLLAVCGWLIDRGSARITARRSARKARSLDDDFELIARHFDDDFPADRPDLHLVETVRIEPVPVPRRAVRRRLRRIPRRPMGRTASNSDRRH